MPLTRQNTRERRRITIFRHYNIRLQGLGKEKIKALHNLTRIAEWRSIHGIFNMKIVHALGWYFPDSLGGMEVYVNGLAQRLKNRGHELSVAAPLRGLEDSREYEHEGIPVFRYPLRGASATRDECQTRASARGSEVLLEWLARVGPDLLHVHTLSPGITVYEIESARAMGIRVIATSHLGNLGYNCQRGTLMRWGQKLCDGRVGVLKCAACSLHAVGLPRPLTYPVAGLSALIGSSAAALQNRAGTVFGMADLIRHQRGLQRRLLNAVDAFVLLNLSAFDRVLLNGAPREKLALNHLGISSDIVRKAAPELCPTSLPVRFGYVGRFAAIKGVMGTSGCVAFARGRLAGHSGMDWTSERF